MCATIMTGGHTSRQPQCRQTRTVVVVGTEFRNLADAALNRFSILVRFALRQSKD